jgi:Rnl2 family RNA ligase
VPPFVPYPKIVDRIAAWNADETDRRALDKQIWVASEKIHGANLCICTDGIEIAVAKRRIVLDPGDPFFGYKRAIAPLIPAVRALFRQLGDVTWALLYGELYGGHYPHPRVAAIDGIEPVQTAIHYCPDVRFCAFDLATVDAAGEAIFVSYRRAVALFEAMGIPVAPVLRTGRLDELLELPVAFATRVPEQLGLPALPDNRAEGMVIKPWDLEAPLAAPRYVLKRKRPEFAETRDELAPGGSGGRPVGDGDALAAAEAALAAMLTDHRVHSAITKLGSPQADTPGAGIAGIVAEVLADLRDELDRAHGELVLSLSRDDASLLWSVVTDDVVDLVTDHLNEASTIDPERYYADLAWAFLRGRLPDAGDGAMLLAAARRAGLRWHKFKRKSGPPRVTQVLATLEGLDPQSLLDIGSGRGAFLWPLIAQFEHLPVTAVDRLAHRVADIEAVHAGGIARVRAHAADVTALPFADASFDIVTILEVLEHLEEPAAAARETLRVASRYVLASVPSHEDDNPEHIQLFTRDSLTALFESAGAERVQISYVLNHMIALVPATPRRPPPEPHSSPRAPRSGPGRSSG